ncbi:MAG: ATP-binding cassette domain-containing protein [Bacteroidetes bacterium]|nr:ATP-binding cassette domain-containing protein [Bacteroidota bacterium]
MSDQNILLQVDSLKKHFNLGHGRVLKAVDGVSFTIRKGETLGLVGESGCGKTTLGRTLIHIYEKTDGKIVLNGQDISTQNRKDRVQLASSMQMIFQDPYSSLNPRMTVSDIIAEGWDIRKLYSAKEKKKRIVELLEMVGLCEEHANRFPHEFSGGQRQRIGIARALAMNPQFIICDEPISALDVSIQAQVMNLLINLQRKLGLTYLFIAHDLSMVKHISDNIAVMYLGHIMEYAGSGEIYKNPVHPYTKVLFSAIPVPDPEIERNRKQRDIKGDVQSPINPPAGCRFASRCPEVFEKCRLETPIMNEVSPGHLAACHKLG